MASLVAQSATSTPQLTMASPELDSLAAVVLSCVVTRQMDSSPTPLALAVHAATTPPLLGDVAALRSIFRHCARAPKSQWSVLKFEPVATKLCCLSGWRGRKAEVSHRRLAPRLLLRRKKGLGARGWASVL